MACTLWGLPHWLSGIIPDPVWQWVLFLPRSQFPHTQEFINIQLNTQGRPSVDLWSSLCEQLSLLRYSALWNIAVFLNQWLPPPQFRENVGLCQLPPLYTTDSKPRLVNKLGHYRNHFIYYPISGITALHCLMSDVLRTALLAASIRSINLVFVITFGWK